MNDDLDDFFPGQTDWSQETYSSDSPVPPPPHQPRHSRKAAARHGDQRRRNRWITVVAVVVVLAIVGALGSYAYTTLKRWNEDSTDSSQVSDYPGPGDGEVQFSVQSGQGPSEVASNLVSMDIIKSQAAFTSIIAANNSTLYPGTFTLKYRMAAADVAAILSDRTKAGGFLEVRAGERVSEVIANAAELSKISIDDFKQIVSTGGQGILPAEAQGSFEGWLEPGAYDVHDVHSAVDILKQLVAKRTAKLDSLGVPTGQARRQTLIIASIAEAEVNSQEYYGKVARVILNRLNKGMNLGMDSTVAYGADVKPGKLTTAMLNDKSNAYNTRVHPGLPPGAISNPGDDAISAALNPEQGDWLYFVTTNLKTGETKFATTEADFWKLRDEYKNSNDDAN